MAASTTSTAVVRRAATRPSRVIVATDFSNRAWSVTALARQVAAGWEIPVEFAHVDTASPWVAGSSATSHLSLRTSDHGRLVDTEVIAGPDVAAALDRARQSVPGSLIALGTHGHVALSKLAFGSVCEQLVTEYGAPVLAVGPMYERAPRIERILVCLAPGDIRTSLAADATRWAIHLGCPMTLLAVDTRHQSDTVWPMLTHIAETAASVGASATPLVVESGDPAATIVTQADAVPGTLLVMAPRSHSIAERMLLGATSLHVLRHTPSGVLLLPHQALIEEPVRVQVPAQRTVEPAAEPAPRSRQRPAAEQACHDEYPDWPVAAPPATPALVHAAGPVAGQPAGCHDDYSSWE